MIKSVIKLIENIAKLFLHAVFVEEAIYPSLLQFLLDELVFVGRHCDDWDVDLHLVGGVVFFEEFVYLGCGFVAIHNWHVAIGDNKSVSNATTGFL
jgi:hypothetical protein